MKTHEPYVEILAMHLYRLEYEDKGRGWNRIDESLRNYYRGLVLNYEFALHVGGYEIVKSQPKGTLKSTL